MVGDSAEPSRRSALPALGALIAIVIGGILLAGLFDSSRRADALRAGDCLAAPEDEQITDVDTVPCDEPHELEVIGTVTLQGAEYPGDTNILGEGIAACEAIFEPYVGEPYEESRWFLNAFTPSAEGWEAGDRAATCLVFRFTADLEFEILTESVRTGS